MNFSDFYLPFYNIFSIRRNFLCSLHLWWKLISKSKSFYCYSINFLDFAFQILIAQLLKPAFTPSQPKDKQKVIKISNLMTSLDTFRSDYYLIRCCRNLNSKLWKLFAQSKSMIKGSSIVDGIFQVIHIQQS